MTHSHPQGHNDYKDHDEQKSHSEHNELTERKDPPAPARTRDPIDFEEMPSALDLQTVLLLLISVLIGSFIAVVILPAWVPALGETLTSGHPKAYWYLSRSSGFVAYTLLWIATALGIMLSSKTAKMWPGAAMAYEIHQHASVLGMLAAIFHALILLGDTYMDYTLATLLIPFSSTGYKPLWIGIGQLALYAFGIVIASSYVRKKLGRALWHAIHVLAYGVFLIGLVHSIGSGTDTGTWWAQTIYWVSGGSIAFLTFYRTLDIFLSPAPAKKRTPASQSPASQSR